VARQELAAAFDRERYVELCLRGIWWPDWELASPCRQPGVWRMLSTVEQPITIHAPRALSDSPNPGL